MRDTNTHDAAWKRVLIVDDDRDTRDLYCESLQLLGFDALIANSVEEALRLVASARPGVVVTDLRFKGSMDGIELAHRIRESEHARDVRIIMLTGATLGDERERAEASGCDRFLVKPCLPEALASEIRRLTVESFSPRRHGGTLRAAGEQQTRRPSRNTRGKR